MILIKLKPDTKIKKKFKTYKIDKRKLENVLNMLTNDLIKTRKWWTYSIKLKGIYGPDSQYFWGEDELEVALTSTNCKTQKERRLFFLQSLVHEYRHWVQSQIQNVSEKKINYTDEDVQAHNDKYAKNAYELECIEWENLVEGLNKFI